MLFVIVKFLLSSIEVSIFSYCIFLTEFTSWTHESFYSKLNSNTNWLKKRYVYLSAFGISYYGGSDQ